MVATSIAVMSNTTTKDWDIKMYKGIATCSMHYLYSPATDIE